MNALTRVPSLADAATATSPASLAPVTLPACEALRVQPIPPLSPVLSIYHIASAEIARIKAATPYDRQKADLMAWERIATLAQETGQI